MHILERSRLLTGKERVLAVFDGRLPDRCPIDFIATPSTEELLMEKLGLSDVEALYQYMGSDFREVAPKPKIPNLGEYYRHIFVKELAPGTFTDSWGITWQRIEMPTGDVFYDVVDEPLRDAATDDDVEDYALPDPADEWDFSGIQSDARRYSEHAVTGKTAAVFEDSWRLLGFERMLLNMATDPDMIHAVLEKVCDYWLEYARLLLEAAGGLVDVMWTCDDLGTQNGPIISPDACRRFVMPLVKERADLFRHHEARVVMHCCGGVAPMIGDMIEAGVEALNPIQIAAAGMDRRELKERYGAQLIFHGSVDQQNVLVPGTPEDVQRDTKECIDILGKDGGYIVAASHEIESDIPVENVKALFLTAQEYGRYD